MEKRRRESTGGVEEEEWRGKGEDPLGLYHTNLRNLLFSYGLRKRIERESGVFVFMEERRRERTGGAEEEEWRDKGEDPLGLYDTNVRNLLFSHGLRKRIERESGDFVFMEEGEYRRGWGRRVEGQRVHYKSAAGGVSLPAGVARSVRLHCTPPAETGQSPARKGGDHLLASRGAKLALPPPTHKELPP